MAEDSHELGAPVAWLGLERGVRVLDADGEEIGRVERVVGDQGLDIFEGLVVQSGLLGGEDLWADQAQIDALHEGGVVLTVGAEQLKPAR